MLSLKAASIKELILHHVGNKTAQEGIVLSKDKLDMGQSELFSSALLHYFLKPFTDTPGYSFTHPADISMNEIYNIASRLFDDHNKFTSLSQDIARILYEHSSHPKIKAGELYIAYFSGISFNEKIVDAIGIFKSENKDLFLKINNGETKIDLKIEDGVNINKLDKGCLIVNHSKDEGYVVYCIDNTNKSEEAQYWKNDFLQLKPNNDSWHNTNNILSLTKQYVVDMLPDAFPVTKKDQAEYLNRSVEYFKANESFDIKEFETTVFREEEIINSYRNFGAGYTSHNEIDIASSFPISNSAVKKQARAFKSVLKLDRNFHIYIHGNTDLIEQGYDEITGKKFYKIYYDTEL